MSNKHHNSHYEEFGWKNDNNDNGNNKLVHNWNILRDNVQDHIRSLNFGYKVQLRDNNITYLNKLGKFISKHELEVTDKKGNKDIISASRFIVAVGGRPTLPECNGSEYVITSDDLFMLPENPGKTCVIGAGYVALECAGFLTGLNQGEVTVLVRSMPLRGFDRDIVNKVTDYMTKQGTKIITGVTPTNITKIPMGTNGSLRDQFIVTYSNGESDTYDTVLSAIGRRADTSNLNFDTIGVKINPSNGKIIATNEQSTVSNIYAIGDVVDKTPELTPVAIMAGKLLAKRLSYGNIDSDNTNNTNNTSNNNNNLKVEYMNYKNVATAVFTPLEIGTVGYSEDDAIAVFGADAVDSYISAFTPLEHTLLHLEDNPCLVKVVVNINDNNKVLGMHIAAPNAGEIIQGFATGIKKGITYDELMTVVGIHPTIAEELVGVTVSKKSGASAEKAGC